MTDRQEYIEARKKCGLTQKDVAAGAKISLLSVVNWENGRNVRPHTDMAIRAEIAAKMRLYKALVEL